MIPKNGKTTDYPRTFCYDQLSDINKTNLAVIVLSYIETIFDFVSFCF